MYSIQIVKRWSTALLAALMLFAAGGAQAAKVLYYYDSYVGTDYWGPSLAARGDTVTTVTSANDLVTQLTAGAPWDAVVVSENNNNNSSVWASAIATYVASGGRLVLNNWYDNTVIDTATEAIAGPPTNQTTGTINAAGIASGLAAGVATNPFTLTNTGWGVFSQALVPTGTGISRCDFATGSCAVFANSGRTMRLGFIPDTLPAADASALLQNAITSILAAPSVTPVTPTAVPTLSEWGMVVMSLLLAMSAIVTLRRQRR